MTKLQELRLKNNLSQSDLSKISGVNFRTLQDFDQGRKSLANAKGEMIYRLSNALACSIDDLLSDCIEFSPSPEILKNQQLSRLKAYVDKTKIKNAHYYSEYYSFPVLEERPGVKMEYIYPTKQKLIANIHDVLQERDEIVAVMLFGSSISMRCTFESDTDLAIRLHSEKNTTDVRNDISEIVQEICDWKADIIWFDRITPSDHIYHDICKGVQIV